MNDRLQVRQCRYCKCTDENPCRLPTGDTCAWLTPLCDRCTNPRCLAAFVADCRRELRETNLLIAKARRAPWPSQLRRKRMAEARRARRKKGRAA